MLLCVLWCFFSSLYHSVGVVSIWNGTTDLNSRCYLCNSLQKWLQVLPCLLHFRATTMMNRHEPLDTCTSPPWQALIRSAISAASGLACLLCSAQRWVSPTHSFVGGLPILPAFTQYPLPEGGGRHNWVSWRVHGYTSETEMGLRKILIDFFLNLVTLVVYFNPWLFLPC